MTPVSCRGSFDATQPFFDVIIAGGGLSGSLAAAVLGRSGYQVCLIDRYASYPPDFRAEHLEGMAVGQLDRLGLLNDLTRNLYRGDTVSVAASGRVISTKTSVNFGLSYETLVNRARSALPDNVSVLVDRIRSIELTRDRQSVHLANGRTITGRLLILATGQGYTLCKQAGMTRRTISESHSLTFGFNIEPEHQEAFKYAFLIYQREQVFDKIDYLSLFTIGARTRANMFTYRDYREEWTKTFLKYPQTTLQSLLPGLQKAIGGYKVVGQTVARPVALYRIENHRCDGVVLIGDAFQSSCPATGMGMVKILTDIARLCTVYIPAWLRTRGMDARKVSEFYDDPIKRQCDAKALHDATYRRLVSTQTGLRWRIHRHRVRTLERLSGFISRIEPSAPPRQASLGLESASIELGSLPSYR